MTWRVKLVLQHIIGPEQSSFIHERQITDNIVVYQEVLYNLRKKKGRASYMVRFLRLIYKKPMTGSHGTLYKKLTL